MSARNRKPRSFPHILPPNDISVNENIPTEAEVKSSIKSQKDNKCKGINNTYAEHFKYANSTWNMRLLFDDL